MSPATAFRNFWHRRLTPRDYAALALLVISVSASVSTGLLYSNARDALHRSEQAQAQGRALRKLTDLNFCRAINQGRKINNRDRQTFIHSRAETEQSLRTVTDPTLRALLKKSVVQVKRELRARPRLALLVCIQEIQHPTGKLPPSLTNPGTTTGG